MIVDARGLPAGQRIEADICIVGAGAAGITLALRLAGAGRRIVLAESGGLQPDARTQNLYDGEAVGLAYRVRESRDRWFGGTTNVWGGACRPLDAIDFTQRPWIAHSGWPFARSALLPYYKQARCLLDLDPTEPRSLTAPWSDPFEAALWEGSPTRFGEKYRDALDKAAGVTTLVNANLVGLVAAASGAAVSQAAFAAIGGPPVTVTARHYVLACGGLENARILLIADRASPGLFGESSDLIGRCFMEHPAIRIGFLVHEDEAAPAARYFVGGGHGLRLTDAVQEEHRIAGAGIFPHGPPPRVADVPALAASLAADITPFTSRSFDAAALRRCPITPVVLFIEQSPDPDSRVILGDDHDALGLPRLRLDWRLSEVDRETLATAAKLLQREAGRQQMGHLWLRPPFQGEAFRGSGRFPLDLPLADDFEPVPHQPTTELGPCSHHMGTTRMHADPRQGVVDPEGRVHGVANLFVAGSSVFPTGGISNPTFTIVALALRLADRLRAET